MNVSRKVFLIQLAGGAWALAGCGGGGDSGTPTPAAGTCSATIAANHGHTLSIAQADLNSTVAMTYNIQGAADHSHSVIFSAAMLASLKAGTAVVVTSTNTLGHDHQISEQCA